MTIVIEIDNTYARIKGLEDLALIDKVSRELSYIIPGAKFSKKFSLYGWDGRAKLLKRDLSFPSGCLTRVEKIFRDNGIKYKLDDNRKSQKDSALKSEWKGYDLRDYQSSIVESCLVSSRGMVKACTGAGKSLVIARLVHEYSLPTVIYVVSLDLLDQMHETLTECLGRTIGRVGNGECDIQDITVCSVWTAGKAFSKKEQKESEEIKPDTWSPSQAQTERIKKMVSEAQLAILDEAQFAAADSIQMILENSFSAYYKFGFSGTPWRSGGDDILLEAAFGSNICDLSATTLINHPSRYLVPAHFVFKDIPKLPVDPKKHWHTVEKEYIIHNEIRNQILVESAVTLMNMGRRPLILFSKLAHGKKIQELLPADCRYRYVNGALSLEERREIRDDFTAGKVDLILASTVYDQGVNLPGLDALVLAGGGKSTAKALQRVGRVIRSNPETNKQDAIIVDTFDQTHFLRKHSFARWQIYNTEPAFKFKIGPAFQAYINKMGYYHGH